MGAQATDLNKLLHLEDCNFHQRNALVTVLTV